MNLNPGAVFDPTTEDPKMPMQPGDVPATWTDAGPLRRLIGYRPQTQLAAFVAWYRAHYHRVRARAS
jgi:hypothetical protein